MNPWFAHLENQDLQWIVSHGRGLYLDPGVSVEIRRPLLILDGQVSFAGRVRGRGAVLGLSEWFLETDETMAWSVDTPVWALELPLADRHRTDWAAALSVAMSAEARLLQPEVRDLADVEAAALKFRYVLSRLETTL